MQTRSDGQVQVSVKITSDFAAVDAAFAPHLKKLDAARDKAAADLAAEKAEVAKLEKEILKQPYGKLRLSLAKLEMSVRRVDENQGEFSHLITEIKPFGDRVSQRVDEIDEMLTSDTPDTAKIRSELDALQASNDYKEYNSLVNRLAKYNNASIDTLKSDLAEISKIWTNEKKPSGLFSSNKKKAWDQVNRQYERIKRLVDEDISTHDNQLQSKKSMVSTRDSVLRCIELTRKELAQISHSKNETATSDSSIPRSNQTIARHPGFYHHQTLPQSCNSSVDVDSAQAMNLSMR